MSMGWITYRECPSDMYHVCGANAELDKAYNSISINFFSNIYYPPIKGWNS